MPERHALQPDPLAQPVVIEDLQRQRQARALDLTLPDIDLDIASVALILLVVGLLFAAAGFLVIPHAPGILRPYTMSIRLVLLAALLLTSGSILLSIALRTGGTNGEENR